MGAMKRLLGWQQSGWPIPRPLAAFAGLVPHRPTAEELADRKAAEREAKAEREAIRAEPPLPAPRTEIVLPDVSAEDPGPGDELPARAAPGWYRLGRTYYRAGSGPFPSWGTSPSPPAGRPATVQGMLF